jgi:hypothetical protein
MKNISTLRRNTPFQNLLLLCFLVLAEMVQSYGARGHRTLHPETFFFGAMSRILFMQHQFQTLWPCDSTTEMQLKESHNKCRRCVVCCWLPLGYFTCYRRWTCWSFHSLFFLYVMHLSLTLCSISSIHWRIIIYYNQGKHLWTLCIGNYLKILPRTIQQSSLYVT